MSDQQFVKDQAKSLFFEHQSFRAIAAQVGISHVTLSRWAKDEDWAGQRKARELDAKELEHQKYLDMLAEVKDRHLKVSRTGLELSFMALREYFLYDDAGHVLGVKLNEKGTPAIGGRTLAQLFGIFSDMERRALGFAEGLPAPDIEKLVASEAPKTVEADPEFIKRLGDAMARSELVVESD